MKNHTKILRKVNTHPIDGAAVSVWHTARAAFFTAKGITACELGK